MSRLKLHLILNVFLYFFSTTLIAQITDLNFRHLTVKEGLSNSTVYCTYQDRAGYIWIGTQEGLNRYNGYEITTFIHQEEDPYSISGNMVTSIAEDKNGNLWIGVWNGGLNLYERSTGRFYTYLNDSVNTIKSISRVFIDGQNLVWVGTLSEGLILFDPDLKTYRRFLCSPSSSNSISSNYISDILEDHAGSLWIATEDSGLNILNRRDHTFKRIKFKEGTVNSLPSNLINKLYEDRQHNLWIGTHDKGVSVLSPDRAVFKNFIAGNGDHYLTSNNIRSFFEHDDNTIWIGTDGGGINIYNPAADKFSYVRNTIDHTDGINSDVVLSIRKSRDGVVWVGTAQGGVNVYNPKQYKFQPFNKFSVQGDGLSYREVLSVCEDKKGYLWIGTDGGGLNLYNPFNKTFQYFKYDFQDNHSLSGDVVKCIYEDSYGNIWIGTYNNGLNLLRDRTGKFTRFTHDPENEKSLSQNDIWAITEDANRNLWIATLHGGLNLFDRNTETFTRYEFKKTETPIGDRIYSMVADNKRKGLWLGTGSGLSYFDVKKRFLSTVNLASNVLNNDQVTVLCLDYKNNLWIGTRENGINRYNPETNTITSFTVKDGLISNMIAGILEDERYNLWISTDKGMSRFDPFLNTFNNYTVDDGLQENEFLIGSCVKNNNGELIFGGVNGFNVFHPDRIERNTYLPEVMITKLFIAGNEVTPQKENSPIPAAISETKQVTLSYDQSDISFEVTAINYINPQKNQYAYMLQGLGQDWHYVGQSRILSFSDLKPGNYTLRVKASNNDGVWSDKEAVLAIHIKPPYWKTWEFRAMLFIFLLTVSICIFYLRLHTIKRQKVKLEEIVRLRTHELSIEKQKIEAQNSELKAKNQEIVHHNREITRQRDEIKVMNEKIERTASEKINFFTNISHEIRTPLTLILGPLEKLLSDPTVAEDHKSQLRRMFRNGLRLRRLVNDILDFRHIDDYTKVLQRSHNDVVALTKDVMAAFHDMANDKKIDFILHSECNAIPALLDKEKFSTVISNLLINAFKFTDVGGSITVTISECSRHELMTGPCIAIKIEDTGIGISENEIDKIFDRFYQARNVAGHSYAGAGIGLSIAKAFIELHSGTITVQSVEGKGSCFTILLPAETERIDEREKALPDENIKVSEFKKRLSPKAVNKNYSKVLVVEDNSDLRRYIVDFLENEFVMIEAATGKEALEKAQQELPDLVITDIMMPGMDGAELCHTLKNNPETGHIPVILLTAKGLPEHKLEGLSTGADDYVVKPFDHQELTTRVRNLIDLRKSLREKFSKDFLLKPQDVTLASPDEKFLKKAMEIIERNISNPDFDVAELVSEMAVSRTLLHTKLKALVNCSAGEFIKTIRLKRAAQLLAQRKVTVSEIAYMVGFKDPQYFNKCFKKHYGETPGSFANRHPVIETTEG